MKPREAAFVAMCAGLTALGAFIRIPLPAIPLTLQTAAVLLSGILLGPRLGALSQAAYVITGLAGAPVFAQGGGFGYVLNPTFGYLLGFVGGAAVTGALTGTWREASSLRLALSMCAGLAVIYAAGVSYLYWNLLVIQEKSLSFPAVVKIGLLVPLPGDILKILLLLPFIQLMKRRNLWHGLERR